MTIPAGLPAGVVHRSPLSAAVFFLGPMAARIGCAFPPRRGVRCRPLRDRRSPRSRSKARGAVFVMFGQVGRGPCGLVLPCFCGANRKLPGPPPRVPPRLAGLGSVQARDRFYIKASYQCHNRGGGRGVAT